jgi:hypothetical protein
MSRILLQEYLTPVLARTIVESQDDGQGKKNPNQLF